MPVLLFRLTPMCYNPPLSWQFLNSINLIVFLTSITLQDEEREWSPCCSMYFQLFTCSWYCGLSLTWPVKAAFAAIYPEQPLINTTSSSTACDIHVIGHPFSDWILASFTQPIPLEKSHLSSAAFNIPRMELPLLWWCTLLCKPSHVFRVIV